MPVDATLILGSVTAHRGSARPSRLVYYANWKQIEAYIPFRAASGHWTRRSARQ